MGVTDNRGIKNYFEHKNNILIAKQNGELYDPAELQERKYTARQKSKFEWVQLLTGEGYDTLATIQYRMRNKYMFEDRMRHLSEHPRTRSLFYSVEQNADESGYHIHLMLKAKKVDSYNLSYALDIAPSNVTYYEKIDSHFKVSKYVNKEMNGDQIHYNFYKK